MEAVHKRILRPLSLALRHELEGWRDENGGWHPGDLERRLAELGIHREKSKPLDEMPHLSGDDRRARVVVDGYLQLRADAGIERDNAVAEFVRESAYTWANRLFALRCMEARSIIEEVILQKAAYAGRSLVHQRFLRKNPDAAAGADDGLFAVLFAEFTARSAELPALFDPQAAAVALHPSVAALKRCVALLSGTETVRGQEPATDEVFSAPDAFGWAYQYWNTEEKDRVFEAVRTKKGTKIEGADIIPATQLYTEPYMVKFLVQNSLGALWMSLHPQSRLCDDWEFYVCDADRAPIEVPQRGRSVCDVTFLDPALGSGHFHLEAFDLFFAMYREENPTLAPREIAASILNRNLFGIDLDERAVQIAEAALWMKAKDAAPDLEAADLDAFHDHLVATNICLPRERDHLEAFLRLHPEDVPLRPALEVVFRGLEHADELGSLLQIEEPMDRELRRLKTEADAANTTPPVQPDMFRVTAVQSALPIGVENYEAWKTGALDRLKTHFEQEAEAADSLRAFFGASARKGLALFDLLARRYDVVAANPPYMGSRNMGDEFKAYVAHHFAPGKRDVYAAFILRCVELAQHKGYVAMVTQQSWMFLRSFADLRAFDVEKMEGMREHDFKGLLRDASLEVLAHLGSGAFEEISGEVVNSALFVLQKTPFSADHHFIAFRLIGLETPDQKLSQLKRTIRCNDTGLKYTVRQADLLLIERSPVIYALKPQHLHLLARGRKLRTLADIRQGVATTADPRFLRMNWEITSKERWLPFEKGEGYSRWAQLGTYRIDWTLDGVRIKTRIDQRPDQFVWTMRMPKSEAFFRAGLTFSVVGCGCLGVRMLDRSIFGGKSPFIFSTAVDRFALAAYLNTRIVTYLLRNLAQGIEFGEGYVRQLPYPEKVEALTSLQQLARYAYSLKSNNLRDDLLAERMDGAAKYNLLETIAIDAVRLQAEAAIENQVQKVLEVDATERAHLYLETGQPAGCFPLVAGFESLPTMLSIPTEVFSGIADCLADSPRRSSSRDELSILKQRLHLLFSAGPNPAKEDKVGVGSEDEPEEEETIVGSRIPFPAETFVEDLSCALEVNPISIYWLLKEGVERENWRCPPDERQLCENRFTVLVLRLLGHRWREQIETGEPLPAWADQDGVIPLTSGGGERPLIERVRERIAEDFPDGNVARRESEFEEIVGVSLVKWVADPFFEHHISQFKKRPIAWQLQSQPVSLPGRRRSSPTNKPVFACLVYYHRLDADLLPKLRSHYLAVLLTTQETELRTLEALRQPTPDQTARKAELEVLVDELNRLDAQLEAVVKSGFGPAALRPRLRQLAVDDAMLAMKFRWLARLRDTLQAAPLAEWQKAATTLGHHAEFPRWIATSIARLPHHCAKAGAECPDAAKLPEDPTPISLAAVICAETDRMTATALGVACAEWMQEWDTRVIDPLRARIAAANAALDTLTGELNTMDRSNTARVEEIAREQKRLRAEVKSMKAEIKTKTEKAGHLAESIRKWSSPELAKWETWLASGPLFDEVSSLDGRRTAPVTIRDFIQQENLYAPDLNDGVRVNIAPLQRAGLLAADVIAAKDVDKAIADRAEWRADERRWVREGKLPRCGWWEQEAEEAK